MIQPQKTIFITGVTDGLGLALAHLFFASGYKVLGLGRKPLAQADSAIFDSTTYCQADLSQPNLVAKVGRFFEQNGHQTLDIVVHNAGVGFYGRFAQQPPLNIDTIIQVNLTAPIQLTHLLLPKLKQSQGRLVFVSSVATILPTPDYAVYTATKKALEGFARSLRIEQGRAVTVQILQPGASHTGMHAKLGISTDTLNWQKFPPAEKVAQQMKRAIERKRPFSTIGTTNKLLGAVAKTTPRLFDRLLARKVDVKPTADSQPPVCLITGAADGIGKALALRFAQAGYHIIGVDIDETKAGQMQAQLGTAVSMVIADLTTESGLHSALAALGDTAVDVLIHNAGISAVGSFETLPLAQQERVIKLNYWAPLRLTSALIQQETLKPDAGLILLSSLSAFVGYPGAAVYAGTKDGLANFGRQMWGEYGRKRHVLTVYPGPTRTKHAARYSPDNSREASRMSPEQLADGIFHTFKKGKRAYIPKAANKLMALMGTLFPPLGEFAMRKLIYDKLDGKTLY